MRGLLRKIFMEMRWPALFMGLGLGLVMALLTALLPKVLKDIDRVFDNMPFLKPILSGLLGIETGQRLSAEMMQAFLWVHPTVLALSWAYAMMYTSRIPAGEIDNGSIDFLLGLPVSRWKLYVTETIGFVISGCVVLCAGLTGHLIAAESLQPAMRPGSFATFAVMANFLATYCAVGGLGFLVSACSDRRGRAVGVMFGVLLLSFLLSFLAQFHDGAKAWSFLSILEYYRPAIVIQSGQFPWSNLSILLMVAATSWTAGGIVLRRRSICTV